MWLNSWNDKPLSFLSFSALSGKVMSFNDTSYFYSCVNRFMQCSSFLYKDKLVIPELSLHGISVSSFSESSANNTVLRLFFFISLSSFNIGFYSLGYLYWYDNFHVNRKRQRDASQYCAWIPLNNTSLFFGVYHSLTSSFGQFMLPEDSCW